MSAKEPKQDGVEALTAMLAAAGYEGVAHASPAPGQYGVFGDDRGVVVELVPEDFSGAWAEFVFDRKGKLKSFTVY